MFEKYFYDNFTLNIKSVILKLVIKMNNNFPNLFMLFMIFSCCGYVCEIICSSIKQKKLVNRGFLCGPYCPIYGVGALFILFILKRFESDPVLVYLLGAIITTALEYVTSFILEKIFHNKWWDYSDEKFNINGRVFLFNSLLFGLGSLVIIYTGYDLATKFISLFSYNFLTIISYILLILFIIDCIYSFIIAYNLRNRLIICEELKQEKLAKIPGMLENILTKKVEKFKRYPKRLLDAFPNLRKTHQKEFDVMGKLRDKAIKKIKMSKKKKKKSKK